MPLSHPAMTIDKYSPVPLYHQVRQSVERSIQQGTYQPNECVPTEEELA